ncbi:MAG: hypothetical protein IH997_02305 [Proteobacteria bacterium]|nr:hypothetical protein [Pseudomonadota bacterium]
MTDYIPLGRSEKMPRSIWLAPLSVMLGSMTTLLPVVATVHHPITRDRVLELDAAKWWANSGSNAEALSKLWLDDRHTVSPQRARNIINWINKEDELTRRWLHLLIPKMTDEALQAFVDEDFKDMTRVVQQELVKRQAIRRE